MSTHHFITVREHTADMLTSLLHLFPAKAAAAFLAGVAIHVFGVDNQRAVVVVLALLTLDLVSGLWSAKASGEAIESRKVLKTASKLAAYAMMISAAHLTESVIGGETYLDDAMVAFLALTELVSILENIGKAGFTVPQKLLNKVRTLRDEQFSPEKTDEMTK